MPKSFLIFLSLFFSGTIYSQSLIFNPITKDSLAFDSISYSISGFIELDDSLELQLDLVEIYPDSLHTVYTLESGFDQSLHPTNSTLQYNPETSEFSVQCGIFNNPNLMVRVLFFRNEEKIFETYTK